MLGVFNKAIPMAEATKLQGVAYKSAEFNWLGSMSRTNSLVVTWKTSGVETLEDARKREITIGAQGLSGTMAAYPFLLNSSQGTRFKVVAGYQGSAAVNLAMERGEVGGTRNLFVGLLQVRQPGLEDQQENEFPGTDRPRKGARPARRAAADRSGHGRDPAGGLSVAFGRQHDRAAVPHHPRRARRARRRSARGLRQDDGRSAISCATRRRATRRSIRCRARVSKRSSRLSSRRRRPSSSRPTDG